MYIWGVIFVHFSVGMQRASHPHILSNVETNMDRTMYAARELLALLKGEDAEDVEDFIQMFESGIKRMSSENDPHRQERGRLIVANALEELGVRPLPEEGTPQDRITGVVAFRGCPESPCSSGAIHCDVQSGGCGLHGYRYGDGKHDCTPVSL